MEIGIGIHGEPGRYREELEPADEIVERLAVADRRGPAVQRRATTSWRSSTAWAARR